MAYYVNGDQRVVFTNTNEDGEPYAVHYHLEDALDLLGQYPNDSVVITLEGK